MEYFRLMHGACKYCNKIYKNFTAVFTKKKAENIKIFTCPNCIIKKYENDRCKV